MPLKFQCNQDPRKMKSVNGKKFCEVCRQNVFDVRRKSIEKITKLRQEKKGCCLIIYEHQLDLSDQLLGSKKKSGRKAPFRFKHAASITALSILSVSGFSQNSSSGQLPVSQNKIEIRDQEGNIQHNTNAELRENGPIIPTKFKGRLIPLKNGPLKRLNVVIGYYDLENNFQTVVSCKSNLIGRFKFALTKKQINMFATGFPVIKIIGYVLTYDRIDFADPKKRIDLYLTRPIFRMGLGNERILD